MKKMFSLEAVLSAQSGIVLCEDIQDIWDVIQHLLNQPIHTHQMPEAHKIVQPALEGQFPWMADVELGVGMDREAIIKKVGLLTKHFGEELEVEQVKDALRLPFTAGLQNLFKNLR